MIASLRGTVQTVALDQVVLDVAGVGYAIRATPATLGALTAGETVTLATTLVVREDSMTLYGFADRPAKELFELVQSVSGVGPKIALALLAVFDPDELSAALAAGDTARLTRAPGIGKKGAERLVLELKDKVVSVTPQVAGAAPAAAAAAPVAGAWQDQLVDALVGLGFPVKQATDVVQQVANEDTEHTGQGESADGGAAVDVSGLLRRALTLLGRSR